MPVRRLILVAAALVVWTFLSYGLVGMTSGSHGCHLLVQVPEGGQTNGMTPPLTQAEMDARTAACSAPKPGDFFIPALGYILIVGVALASATAGKEDRSVDP